MPLVPVVHNVLLLLGAVQAHDAHAFRRQGDVVLGSFDKERGDVALPEAGRLVPEDQDAGLEIKDEHAVRIDVNALVGEEQLLVGEPFVLAVSDAHVAVSNEEFRARVQEEVLGALLSLFGRETRGFVLLELQEEIADHASLVVCQDKEVLIVKNQLFDIFDTVHQVQIHLVVDF